MNNKVYNPIDVQILLVDDSQENLKLLTKILSNYGFRVRVSTSGKLALRSVKAEHPDLILLDVEMPEMDGYEVCRQLKNDEKTFHIPVIFISAHSDSDHKIKGFEVGGFDYLTKPFKDQEVFARVNTHLNLHFLHKQIENKNNILKEEIIERKKAQEELIDHKNNLEEIVKKRTDELRQINEQLKQEIKEHKIAQKEKEKLFEQLHQSQKMDAIGQLAGGVAHDFNNMLGAIIGAAELIKNSNCSPSKTSEYIELILNASKRAGELTEKLLTFSRRGTKYNKTINICDIVNETVSLLRRTINKSISISVIDRAERHLIMGDLSLLENALMNIGINSSHAMPNGGKITIIIENEYLDTNYCNNSTFKIHPGEYVKISVKDTGTGIDHKIIPHIFEPFFTTKEQGKGTGLGLAAVYGSILDHKGAVTVNSTLNKGTEFIIHLPTSQAKQTSQRATKAIQIDGKGTVLLVDDEEFIRITAAAMLKEMGYKVIFAENGEIGLEKYLNNRDQIDLIILDMIMPIMGGKEVLHKIREIDKLTPVLISSGFHKDSNVIAIKDLNPSGFLKKPFRMDDLSKTVNSIVKKKLDF